MTVHQVPAGTMADLPAKPEPVAKAVSAIDYIEGVADPRIQQSVALAIYRSAGSRVVYTALGVAASLAAKLRTESAEALTPEDALRLIQEENYGTEALRSMGLDYANRIGVMQQQLALKHAMEQLVKQNWTDFQGTPLEQELKRTADPREVNPADVEQIFAHFEGEISKADITNGLRFDNETEAKRNAKRIEAAAHILKYVDAAPNLELAVADERRLFEQAFNAVKRLEMDCLTNKARGFSSSIERFACASLCKQERKTIEALLKHSRFKDPEEGHAPASNDAGVPTPRSPDLSQSLQSQAKAKSEERKATQE